MSRTWNTACVVACFVACSSMFAFDDDFERADGPVGGWTVANGTWQIVDGRMTSIATSAVAPGSWIFAGEPPITAVGDTTISATVDFPIIPADAVGRHGGLIFFASLPQQRGTAGMNAYTLDWIDRVKDHGFRLRRIDNGADAFPLVNGTPELVDPPLEWIVEVSGPTIRLFADGEEIFAVDDETYRSGHVGVWAYQNGTQIDVDEIQVELPPIQACITATPGTGPAPLEVLFDGTCSRSDGSPIVAYRWNFGDGSNDEEGESAEHVFQFADTYVVSLEIENANGDTATATKIITASPGLEGGLWSDDFERADGPVDNWTVFQGAWSILDGELTTLAVGVESWAWGGDPAVVAPETHALEFRIRFNNGNDGGVGRHGGVAFCANASTQRYAMSGYTLDWIDRVDDHGFRLIRFDNGVHPPPDQIVRGATDLVDPPELWRIELIEDRILVFGDGELLMQHVDSTYRGGHFGFWAYHGNSNDIAIDDVIISDEVSDVVFANRTLSGVDCDGNASVDLTFTVSGDAGEAVVEVTETLPAGAVGVDAGGGAFGNGQFTFSGTVSDGQTITYTLTGLSDGARISGVAALSAILGDATFIDECPFGCDEPHGGFSAGGIRAGVILGPIALDPATNADCFDGGRLATTDYLIDADGDMSEEELGDPDSAPAAGDKFYPDFGGLAGGLGVAIAPNTEINPGAAEGELTAWLARADSSGYIDYNRSVNLGNPLDDYVIYSFHYLKNTTGDPLPARLEIGSDDGVKVRLNGEFVHQNAACRAVPGYGAGDMVDVVLEDGVNVLMLAVVERGGGTGLRVILRDEFGDPLIPFDEDEEPLVEVCKGPTDGPTDPVEICDNERDDDGDGEVDCDDSDCSGEGGGAGIAPNCVVVGPRFVRGDADASGGINLTDGVRVLLWSFQGGIEPECLDAADTDDSGSINLSDPIRIFQWLFLGGVAPVDPDPSGAAYVGADCGLDPTESDPFGCLKTTAPCI